MRFLLLLFLGLSSTALGQTIELQAGPGTEGAAARIREVPRERIERVADLFGAGNQSVIVVLAPEDSSLARGVAPWVAGYAQPSAGVVVIFPARASTYPYSDLEETYLHELAHVFIGRASRGGEIPRWFHESIAMAVSTPWTLEDRGRTTLAMLRRWDATPSDMERWFRGDQGDARRAYAIGESFGRDFIRRYGVLGVQRILQQVGEGVPFERAFREFTGRSTAGAWAKFWEDQTFVSRTVPLITSGTVLWFGISLLALLAFRRRRQRDALIREQWILEEQMELLQHHEDDEVVN